MRSGYGVRYRVFDGTDGVAMTDIYASVDELVGRIADGSQLVLAKDLAGAPMAAIRALIRAGVSDLHLVTAPTSGWPTELLVGAGAVACVETSGVSLGEHGGAPRFNRAVKSGSIRLKDATCPAIYAALQAGEKGIPFIPIRGIIGSDVQAERADWKVIDNPFAEGGREDPLLLLPAIRPDVALFHARKADRHGNVHVGLQRELTTVAHAARSTLVTVEEVVDGDLMASEESAACVVPAIYITAIAEAPRGAWPLRFLDMYEEDAGHLSAYVAEARSDEGFERYLEREVFGRELADA